MIYKTNLLFRLINRVQTHTYLLFSFFSRVDYFLLFSNRFKPSCEHRVLDLIEVDLSILSPPDLSPIS